MEFDLELLSLQKLFCTICEMSCVEASNSEAVHEVQRFHEMCSILFPFRLPSVKGDTDFKQSFVNFLNSQEAVNFTNSINFKRNDMLFAIESADSLLNKLASVDAYLPLAFRLMRTLTKSSSTVNMKIKMKFEWKSSFGQFYFKSSDIQYDVLMTLHTKVFIYFDCILNDAESRSAYL